MARKTFTTTIDENLQAKFKTACSEKKIDMNEVLEAFMKGFIEGDFTFERELTMGNKTKKTK